MFRLLRTEDETGVSGTGYVAEGVWFTDGEVALHWTVPNAPTSTAVYRSIVAVEEIHGHNGKTIIEWLD